MRCNKCGNNLNENDCFCYQCGTKVEKQRMEKQKKSSEKINLLVIIVAVLACVLIGVLCIYYMLLQKNNADDVSLDKVIENGNSDTKELTFVNLKNLAAGYAHSIAFDEDGLYYSYGDNTYGQCEIQEWSDIVSLAAGESHSVGLRRDGTVVAVGDNSEGQCNVQSWTDIVAIDAYYNHTVGLKKDGTVVATGNNEYGQCDVQAWSNIKSIGCGVYHTLGVMEDGTVVAVGNNESGQCNVENWKDVISVYGGWHHSIGLKADGTLESSGSNDHNQIAVDNIENAVEVACGEFTTVVRHSEGMYTLLGIPEDVQNEINNWADVVRISAKNNHYTGLNASGVVYEAGIGYSRGFPDGLEIDDWGIGDAAEVAENDSTIAEEDIVDRRYEAFAEKIKQYESKYGEASVHNESEWFSYMTGLCFAKLVDFSQSGQEELLLVYQTDIDTGYDIYREYTFEIWGYQNGEILLLDSGELFGTDGGVKYVSLIEYNGKNYLVTGGTDDFGYYYYHGYSNGKFGIVRKAVWECDENGEYVCTIDGKSVSYETFEEEWEKWHNNETEYCLNENCDIVLGEITETKNQLGIDDSNAVEDVSGFSVEIQNTFPDQFPYVSKLKVTLADGTVLEKLYGENLKGNTSGWYGDVLLGDLTGDGQNEIVVNLMNIGSTYGAADIYVYTIKGNSLSEILSVDSDTIQKYCPHSFGCVGVGIEDNTLEVFGIMNEDEDTESAKLKYMNNEWHKI